MPVSSRHILHQTSVLRAIGQGAAASLLRQWGALSSQPTEIGEEKVMELPPRPNELVDAFLRHLSARHPGYRHHLPPHLFPQWCFPAAVQTLAGAQQPLFKMLNAGCSMVVHAPLPRNVPLIVKASLRDIDTSDRRILFRVGVTTGTADIDVALDCEMRMIIPLRKAASKPSSDKNRKTKKERARVPTEANELAFFRLSQDAGLDFAKLTGDFNPIHWLAPAARMSGFRNCILHGFGTMSRAIEGLNKNLFSGDVWRLRSIDVRFTNPLVLPAKVGLYIHNQNEICVGDAPGGRAYLVGSFATTENHHE